MSSTLEHRSELKQVKKIKVLHLKKELQLIILVKAQPQLEDLDLVTSNQITLTGIKEAFMYGRNLSRISLRSFTLDIALDKQVLTLDDGRKLEVQVFRFFKGVDWTCGDYIFRLRSTQHK